MKYDLCNQNYCTSVNFKAYTVAQLWFFYHDRSYHIQGSENFRFGQYFWTPCCATKKLNHCSEIPKHALYLAQVSKGNSFFSRYSWKGNDHKDTGSLWGRKVRKWKILLFSIVFFFHSFISDFFKICIFQYWSFPKSFFYGSHIKRSLLQKLCMVQSPNAPSFSFSPQDCYIFYFPKWTEFLCCVSLSWREAE